MVIRLRTAFFIGLFLVIIGFLYFERGILTPFILAGIFAYIFNPFVDFFYHKVKLPRTLSILIIYFLLIAIFVIIGVLFVRGIREESSEFKMYIDSLIKTTKVQVNLFPSWIKPSISDTLLSLDKLRILSSTTVLEFFPQAVSRIISFFIFLFAGFYFLKEGRNFIYRFIAYFPKEYRIDVEILLRKTNQILSGYLRGQLFLVFLISLILFLALSALGVKFALLIAVFSGIAEIVPIIGPIVAAGVAALVVFLTGSSNFSLSPVQAVILVLLIYFVIRQVQDYFISPLVMGKVTKLHPLVILFAVLAGGHSFGVMGLILAVPIAAVLKLLWDFFFDKINDKAAISSKK